MTDTNFPGFPGLNFEILVFHDFPGFPWSVRTLYIYTERKGRERIFPKHVNSKRASTPDASFHLRDEMRNQSKKRNWIKPVQELSTQIISTTKIKSQNWKMENKLMNIKKLANSEKQKVIN